MEVYRRTGSPFWYFDHAVAGGVRVRRSTRLLSEGKAAVGRRVAEKAAQALAEAADKEASGPHLDRMTLREALDRYCKGLLASAKSSAGNTAALRDKCLGLTPVYAGRFRLAPEMPLADLTPVLIERLVAARQTEGNSPQTIAHELKMLRAATRDAASLGYKVPLEMVNGSVKNPWRMPKVSSKTRYLSWEEFALVFSALDPDRQVVQKAREGRAAPAPYQLTGTQRAAAQDAQDLLVALAMTGGRWSEVAALTWERVDTAALERPGATVTVKLYGTKDGEERLLGAPEQVCSVLRRRWATRDPRQHLIFPGRTGGARGATCRAIIRAMDNCGLNRPDTVSRYGRATVHSLRHTFASWQLQNGADLAEVQDALGHASMQMTRRYAHLARGKTAEKMANILSGLGQLK